MGKTDVKVFIHWRHGYLCRKSLGTCKTTVSIQEWIKQGHMKRGLYIKINGISIY